MGTGRDRDGCLIAFVIQHTHVVDVNSLQKCISLQVELALDDPFCTQQPTMDSSDVWLNVLVAVVIMALILAPQFLFRVPVDADKKGN